MYGWNTEIADLDQPFSPRQSRTPAAKEAPKQGTLADAPEMVTEFIRRTIQVVLKSSKSSNLPW